MTITLPLRRVKTETNSHVPEVPGHALIDANRVVWFSTPPSLLYGPAGARLSPREITTLHEAMGQREAALNRSKPHGRIHLQLEAVTPRLVLEPWFGKLAPYLADSNVAVLWRLDGTGDGAKQRRQSHFGGRLKGELGRLALKQAKQTKPAAPKGTPAPYVHQLRGHVSALTALVIVASVKHSPEAMHKLVQFDPGLVADDIRRTGLGVFFGDDIEWLLQPRGVDEWIVS